MKSDLRRAGLLLAILLLTGCAKPGAFVKRPLPYPKGLDAGARHFLMKQGSGSLPSYDVPIVINDQVEKWVHYFSRVDRGRFALYLSRSGRYENFMRQILREEGLPQDLIYLALIESGFSNHAYSRAHAAGPWQFIYSTGKNFGLKINSWIDERRDPEKATRAAAQYLKKLYREFGDWYLAMAAYNAGEGRIRRAIAHNGVADFWVIGNPRRHYLRPETENYVPKFIAAALIAKSPHRFGFGGVRYEPPIAFTTVSVEGPLGLDVAAELAGDSAETLQRLNPELKMGMTPNGRYRLKIPEGSQNVFLVAYAQIPPSERVRVVHHQVRRGDSIWRISRRYGVSVGSILAANGLSQRQGSRIHPGQRLVIPKQGRTLLAYNEPKGAKRERLDGVEWLIRKEHKTNGVEKAASQGSEAEGNSRTKPVVDLEGMEASALPRIAEEDLGRKERVSPVEIGTDAAGNRKPNAQVEAAPIPRRVYVVRRGDNLWRIARHHGVTVSNLKTWNGLNNAHYIRAGRSLIISQ